jgi:O-antigen ligase
METKDLIGLILVPLAVFGGTAVLSFIPKLRGPAFFFMVAAFVISDKLDINFISRQWYRGTTRGIEFSFVDVLAFSLVFSSIIRTYLEPRPEQKGYFWPASLGLMLLFLVYECFSVAVSEPKLFGIFEITKTIRAIMVFLAGAFSVRSERDLQLLVLALGCAVALESVLAVKHKLILHVERATGTFDHANSLSMYICMVSPLFVAAINSSFPRYIRYFSLLIIPMAAVAVVATLSRAGIPIFAMVMIGATLVCMSWKITLRKIAGFIIVLVGFTALLALSWDTFKERFEEAGLKQELDTTQFENRGQYYGLAKVILHDHFLGLGLNNWSYHVSKSYGEKIGSPYEDYDDIPPSVLYSAEIYDWAAKYAPPAHNLALITVGELGIPGLILFGILWIRWFWIGAKFLWRRTSDPLYRMGTGIFFGMCGIFLQSLTEWVYRQTQILLTFHVLLGALMGLYLMKKRAPALQPIKTAESAFIPLKVPVTAEERV